jgi:glutamate racemase
MVKGKKTLIPLLLPLLLPLLVFPSCSNHTVSAHEESLRDFFKKKKVTIAVTDSGLGGLSILAEAVERSRTWRSFQKVDFIFFNALFSNWGGYNSLPATSQKTMIFDSALHCLENKHHPDLILIGCNTLSTLYDLTPFARQHKTLVRGIIEAGVELASVSLKAHPDAKIVLFGTQTTVSQKSHRDGLLEKGFLPQRILYQACPELVTYIENDPQGEETEMLINAYVDEALQKIGEPQPPLLASLNCTHYGFSYDIWAQAFESRGIKLLDILNPNSRMIAFLYPQQSRNRCEKTDISVRIISMVEIEKKKRDSLGDWLRRISPLTADALQNYELREDLFEWKRYTEVR